MGLDEQEIREVHSARIAAVNAGDLVRLLTLMSDDAIFLNPGEAPFGRDGFSANFSAAHRLPSGIIFSTYKVAGPLKTA